MIIQANKAQDPGWVNKLESQWYCSSLEVGRFKMQEKPVFLFHSKDRKN